MLLCFWSSFYKVRSLVSSYKYTYVITLENSRNARLAELRQELPNSVFLFGKNKVIAVAFGRDKKNELKPGLHKLTKYIKGQCALLFSDSEIEDLRETFNKFRSQDYARSGSVAAQTVRLRVEVKYTLHSVLSWHSVPVFNLFRWSSVLVLFRNFPTLWSLHLDSWVCPSSLFEVLSISRPIISFAKLGRYSHRSSAESW